MLRVFRGSIFLFTPTNHLRIGQQVAELGVVHLHAVIQVEADLLVGGMFWFFFERAEFGFLLFEAVLFFLQFFAMASTGRLGFVAFELFSMRAAI